MSYNLNSEDLRAHLQEQLEFLEISSNSFDNGFIGESKRLAVTARVLVHDTARSESLLKILELKNVLFFDTSFPFEDKSVSSHSGLVRQVFRNEGIKVIPLLDDGPFSRRVSFDAWWNGIVFVDCHRNEFSRKDIVLSLANKEGGAHVDSKLDDVYFQLRNGNSLQLYDVDAEGRSLPGEDQVPATMRQIAHELLKTLKSDYSKNRDPSKDDLLFVAGVSAVLGEVASPIPSFNLVKNRPVVNGKKIGRNDLCSCGSGAKYKKCCLPR
jgi:hypothetical protein